MTSLLSTGGLARMSARRPWPVVGAWLLTLVLSGLASAFLLGGALTSEITFTNDPESVRGFDLIDERMTVTDPATGQTTTNAEPIAETVIVRSETTTVDDPVFQALLQRTEDAIRAVPGIASAQSFLDTGGPAAPAAAGLISPDRRATLIPVAFAGDLEEAESRFQGYMTTVTSQRADGFQVLTVGTLSIDDEFNAIAESDLQVAEVVGLPVALLILVVVFGALVAAGIPVALALMSIAVAVGLTALIGQLFELSFFVVNMITMIGLAVGIDYALFIVERYREERRRGAAKHDAIETAGATASKAVLFSGITVVLALTGMLLIPTTIFLSLGLGAILVVIVAVLATLTLIPAMLSLLGDRIDWPRRRHYDAATAAAQAEADQETYHRGFWGRTTRVVMARPALFATLAVLLLGGLSLPYFGLERGQAGISTLPDSDVKTAFTILQRDFAAGRLAPVEIVINGQQSNAAVATAVQQLTSTLEQDPNIGAGAVQTTWNDAGDLALVKATLKMDGNAPEAFAMIERLRNEVVPETFGGVPAEALVTGETAFNADFFQVVDDWTPIVFAFVLGLSFLLLLLVFRSIVIPIKAIILNLLSVGAAYGLMVLVFQEGVGADLLGFQQTPTIEAWVPIFLFCVLFGLSMDYHVFLLSRIKEHYDETKRNAESVAVGLQATARIITGAALIMVVVFAGFAMGNLVMFQQMGFGLAIAVLLDATIVRSVLVPAGMAMLGDWNWYLPSWLTWLPNLNIEGARPPVLVPPVVPEGAGD